MRTYTGVILFAVLLTLPVARAEENHSASKSESETTRETKAFPEYETLINKFTKWGESVGEAKHKETVDKEWVKVQLSKSEYEKATGHLKRIKWYREKLVSNCESNDPSTKLLGEYMDSCLAPGLMTNAVKEVTKIESQYELKFATNKLHACKRDLKAYFDIKKQTVGEEGRSKHGTDWEIQLKLNEFFDLFIGQTKVSEVKQAESLGMHSKLKEVSIANLCSVDVKPVVKKEEKIKDQGPPKAVAQPTQQQGYQQKKDGYAYPKSGYSTQAGGYGGGCGYGASYGAGGCGGGGSYNYKPQNYQFNPSAYKFDPNRYNPNNQNYDGGGYTPPMYFPNPNYDKPYNPPPRQPVYPPPPRVDNDPPPPVQPYPPQYPQPQPNYPIIPPYMPPPATVTPYFAGGGGFTIESSGRSSYTPPYVMQSAPLNLSLSGGLGMGCTPNLLGTPCPNQFARGFAMPGAPMGVPNVNQPFPMQPPQYGGMPGIPNNFSPIPGMPGTLPPLQTVPGMGYPGGTIPGMNYPPISGNNTTVPRPPVYQPVTNTNDIPANRTRIPRQVKRSIR